MRIRGNIWMDPNEVFAAEEMLGKVHVPLPVTNAQAVPMQMGAMDVAVQWAAAQQEIEAGCRPSGSEADLSFYRRLSKTLERRVRSALLYHEDVLTLLGRMLDRGIK